MKPLVDITEAVGADKWIMISTLKLHKLLNTHFVHDANDSQLTKSMKRVLSGDLSERYTNDKLQLLTKACFLDPRFKSLKFLSEASQTEVICAYLANKQKILRHGVIDHTPSSITTI